MFEISGDIKFEGVKDDDIKDGVSGDVICCDIIGDDFLVKLGFGFVMGVIRDDVI